VLENYKELPSDYHEKVKMMKDKYYPVEIDTSVSLEEKIPLVIQWYKEANGLLADTALVSNFLEFNESGQVLGLKESEELIHMYNKSQSIQKISCGDKFSGRKNVVLLGDSLGDLKMADGVKDPEAVLTVGFLNKNIEKSLETYKDNFDIVLCH